MLLLFNPLCFPLFLPQFQCIASSGFEIDHYHSFNFISCNKAISVFSDVMPSSSKSKGKKRRHRTDSRRGSHHASSRRQEESGESSQPAHQEETGAGREFGANWRNMYNPGSDESSASRGRHRLQDREYEGYSIPSPSPPRRRQRDSRWGDAARASLEDVQRRDRQVHARNSWREAREAARARGELVDQGTGCGCVIL